ncbi:TetR/AcrR family transcriptional regulator [Thermoflexus sp.]|uniref:TetR/AcrR family transcriptional regulator n=1 Tax=Thermoflexus sp. TaxID=1969742 RepID=UPI002ADDA711|nr:TetR/AcrR family transcriptional regulator [Thermoflexus sp.]
MGKKPPNFRKQQREETRRRIIEAAFRVFVRKGFKGTSNREIAREAGISPGLIYWYFRNKEDLFQAVVETKSLVFPLQQMAQTMREASPREFLSRVMELGAALARDPAMNAAMQLLLPEAIRNERVRRVFVARAVRPGLRAIADYLAVQQAKGLLRPLDPRIGAQLWMGLLLSQILLSRLLRIRSPAPLDRLLAESLEVYLYGVLAPTAAKRRR